MTPAGKSVFVSDGAAEPITVALVLGVEWYEIWGGDATPRVPCDGGASAAQGYFPREQGFRFGFFSVPAAGQAPPADLDMDAALAEPEVARPARVQEMDNPGMHRTDTVDYIIVVSGEVSPTR